MDYQKRGKMKEEQPRPVLSAPARPRQWIRKACLLVLVLRLLMGLAYPFTAGSEDLGPDGQTYIKWAQGIDKESYPWPSLSSKSTTFLFCLMLSGLGRVTGWSLLAFRFGNLLLWIGLLCVSFVLIRDLFGERVAWIGTATLSLDDPYLFIKYVGYELVFTILVLAGTFFFVRAIVRGQRSRLVLAGIAFGLAFLTQSKVALLPAAYVLVLALFDGSRPRRPLREWALVLLIVHVPVGLCAGLLAVRHHSLTGRFSMSTGMSGLHLLAGNNPNASGTLDYGYVTYFQPPPGIDGEDEQALYRKKALEFIRERPGFVLTVLVPRKMWHLFELYRVRNVIIVALLLVGIGICLRRGMSGGQLVLLVLVLYVVLVHAVYYGWGRYRFPALPAVHAFVGVSLCALASWCRGGGRGGRDPHGRRICP